MRTLTIAHSMWLTAEDVSVLSMCGLNKAYEIIRKLAKDQEKNGFVAPPSGQIQKRYYCERCNMPLEECEAILDEYYKQKRESKEGVKNAI